MSDAAIDATADALVRRALGVLPEEPTRADLAALAPPLARLLDARLNAELHRAAPASAWVDADATADALQAWKDAAEPTARIPRDQRRAVVQRATERALTHLLRPADTLAAVAFQDEPGPLPVDTALARIRIFGPYPYLAQITERYVEHKGLSHIDRAGLERLIRRIDRRMVSAFGVGDWMTLLEPLFDWVSPLGRPPGTVSTGLLRTLFQAKGATLLHDALSEIDTVDAETLRELIAKAIGQDPAPRLASAPPTEPASAPRPDQPPAAEPGAGPESTPGGEPEPDVEPETAHEVLTDPEPEPDEVIWPTPPPSERQPGPWETDEPAPLADALGPDVGAEGGGDDEPALAPAEDMSPPVIGSHYATPKIEPGDSGVLGPPRPLDAVEGVRDDLTEPEEVEDATETKGLAEGEALAPESPVLDIEPDAAAPPEEIELENRPSAPDDEPLWQRLARERGAQAIPPPAITDDDQPLWKRFAQSELAERLPDADGPETAPTATLADSFATPPPPASEVPTDTASGPRLPLDDLEARVLGADAHERRDWYVAELFGGSPGEYHRTLAAIDAAPSYTDATAVISSEILRKRSVSPYTECAVAFIDAVQAQSELR